MFWFDRLLLLLFLALLTFFGASFEKNKEITIFDAPPRGNFYKPQHALINKILVCIHQ